MCAAMGRHGADLLDSLPVEAGILTHCNAGALVSGSGDGTALAVIFELARRGKLPRVFADETRPLLQGARLTMWELMQRGIDATLICDSAAAQVMREGRIQAVITGADRIAANGDTANKIGTYGVATLAQAHGIPFSILRLISDNPESPLPDSVGSFASLLTAESPGDRFRHFRRGFTHALSEPGTLARFFSRSAILPGALAKGWQELAGA